MRRPSNRRSKQPIYRSSTPSEPLLATCPCTFLFFPRKKKLFRSLLREVAEERLRYRPHRHSPRAVKRKMSNYLTATRVSRRRHSRILRMDAAYLKTVASNPRRSSRRGPRREGSRAFLASTCQVLSY